MRNFDSLTVDLAQYTEQFSIIELAETNIDETNKSSFDIPGYLSEYNSKFPGKSKGRVLGIYISEIFQFTSIKKLCFCTVNLESLFTEVTNFNAQGPIFIGVIYRPPNGYCEEALHEIYVLMYINP